MHLVRPGLSISTAVFATGDITTIQTHIVCNLAHSIPLCFNESRLVNFFPIENPSSDSGLASNCLSILDSRSTQSFLWDLLSPKSIPGEGS
jgi:hypothetical protein